MRGGPRRRRQAAQRAVAARLTRLQERLRDGPPAERPLARQEARELKGRLEEVLRSLELSVSAIVAPFPPRLAIDGGPADLR